MLKHALMGICLVLSLASCASTAVAPGTAKSTAVAGAAPALPPGCVSPDPGTRLPARPVNCSEPASVYDKERIDRTGQADVGDSLRMLGTGLTVH